MSEEKLFSIAIRTLGKAGNKYQKLLNSIKNSNIQPDKVVVVLPHGYLPPEEKLGYEEFVYCPKSMIRQRIEAVKYIDSPYTLFLDDDIEFDPVFIERLLEPIITGKADCTAGPLFSFFPKSIPGKIAGTLTSSVSISLFHRDMYVKILRSGGWSYHTFDTDVKHYYPTESFAWTCFLIRTEVMRRLDLETEQLWLERFGYACGDDRVMAYKLIKQGYKAVVVSNALYTHNDAQTSKLPEETERMLPKFCMYYMHTVFWHRFIYSSETDVYGRILDSIAFIYWKASMNIYHTVKAAFSLSTMEFRAFRNGVSEGKRYIHSEEYKGLPPII